MARPVDLERRRRLLEAAVDYVIEHGLSSLSLRPLAAALETDAPVLLHHFGSKENLLVQILNGVRDRLRQVAADAGGPQQLQPVWEWAAAPEHEPLYRLFFEAYGIALRNPGAYREFLDHVVADWLAQLGPSMGEERATLAIAAVRGLLLDLLTTGDRARVDNAVRLLTGLLAADPGS